ncbi:hypothetical protein EV401DRAFT_1886396 [Pisolithus croceorrhizus]|nr:hypothetical protein EV401DRAFT_1886396 [Pisolithus croceorrhizus]
MTQWTAWPGFSGSGSNAVYEASLLRFKPHVVQSTAAEWMTVTYYRGEVNFHLTRAAQEPHPWGTESRVGRFDDLHAGLTVVEMSHHKTDGWLHRHINTRTQGESILHLCDRPRYTIYDMMDGRRGWTSPGASMMLDPSAHKRYSLDSTLVTTTTEAPATMVEEDTVIRRRSTGFLFYTELLPNSNAMLLHFHLFIPGVGGLSRRHHSLDKFNPECQPVLCLHVPYELVNILLLPFGIDQPGCPTFADPVM